MNKSFSKAVCLLAAGSLYATSSLAANLSNIVVIYVKEMAAKIQQITTTERTRIANK